MIKDHPYIKFTIEVMKKSVLLSKEVYQDLAGESLTKDDRSPVTVADLGIQAVVGYDLSQSFPDEKLVGEEDADILQKEENQTTRAAILKYVQRVLPHMDDAGLIQAIDHGNAKPEGSFWVLDPVDGTKGFLRGGQYAIALAKIENGEVVFAALGCPNLGEYWGEQPGALIIAAKGEGTWHYDCQKEEFVQVKVSEKNDISKAVILSSFHGAHTKHSTMDRLTEALGIEAEPLRLDSQSKHALLAVGKGELFFRFPPDPNYREKIWDAAAGALIIEEAGGKITDLSGEKLHFRKGYYALEDNFGIFASNGFLHQVVLEKLQQHISA